jgi:PhoH-like ATPase
LLLDDYISLVTLIGPSGTGKTLLAVAAGVEKVMSEKVYDKLIVTRPVQSVGKDMGYLPGTLQEKMDPWVAPIKDNLKVLFSNKATSGKRRKGSNDFPAADMGADPYLAMLIERGQIEVEAISYIRGRSIPRAFMIIDEAQNLTVHELKTILTRAGHGTKIVLTGDIEQIDNSTLDAFSNGLTHSIEKFKEFSISGHMTLVKGERSDLATLASRVL